MKNKTPWSSETEKDNKGPLSNVRVLDLTSVLLGPIATQVLGDYGADVIKVEPISGDLMRANGVSRHAGMGSIFLSINRNKRSLAVDMKQRAGREVVMKLAATCDVLVHNMRIPATQRLGIEYATVLEQNPKIIYCAATGFGQDGPDRYKPAFDDIIQAACGLAGLMEQATGKPSYVPSLLADKTAGFAVVTAIFAALLHREKTGEGQFLEVPMFETLVEYTMSEHMGGLAFDPSTEPAGYGRIIRGGRRPAKTADGYIAMLPYSPIHWRTLFTRVDRTDIVEKYDFSDGFKVNSIVRNLYAELEEITPTKTSAQWKEICEDLDIPVTDITAIDNLPENPHLKAVNMFKTMDHPSEGRIRYVRPAAIFERSPLSVRRHAPLLGEHTEEILKSLGYSADEIENFVSEKIVSNT